MSTSVLDIRSATCPGGGSLWAFLSHIREIPPGGTMEVLTDDPLARTDLPEWAEWEGWGVLAQEDLKDHMRFVLERPEEGGVAPGLARRTATR